MLSSSKADTINEPLTSKEGQNFISEKKVQSENNRTNKTY